MVTVMYFMYGAAMPTSTGLLRSEDKGATWQIINDDTHQFGGPGNVAQFVIGDQGHYGRFYMRHIGHGHRLW